MEIRKLAIHGRGARSLFDIFKDRLSDEGFDRHSFTRGDLSFFVLEKYYVNLKCTLLFLVFFEFLGEDECRVRVISTEHQADVLDDSWLWSAEKKGGNPLVKLMEQVCAERGWSCG
ncbi:MAG: hypothetical protein JW724_05485 [Candidatus Altiarchaeota archaeon]|nr:hypothetical protein [Candidatus Altiarchaeota archaeon]